MRILKAALTATLLFGAQTAKAGVMDSFPGIDATSTPTRHYRETATGSKTPVVSAIDDFLVFNGPPPVNRFNKADEKFALELVGSVFNVGFGCFGTGGAACPVAVISEVINLSGNEDLKRALPFGNLAVSLISQDWVGATISGCYLATNEEASKICDVGSIVGAGVVGDFASVGFGVCYMVNNEVCDPNGLRITIDTRGNQYASGDDDTIIVVGDPIFVRAGVSPSGAISNFEGDTHSGG